MASRNMNRHHIIIRKARSADLAQIYRICCMVELTSDEKKMSQNGFLLINYSQKPELKRELSLQIQKDIFLVAKMKNKIIGFIHGHDTKQWIHTHGSHLKGKILKKLGIRAKEKLSHVVHLDKIAIHPKYQRLGQGSRLLKYFLHAGRKHKEKYVVSEVVSAVYTNGKRLQITNEASMKFHEHHFFRKIGNQEYSFEKTFLKKSAKFVDTVFLLKIET